MTSKKEGDVSNVVELPRRSPSDPPGPLPDPDKQLVIECLLLLRAFRAIQSRGDRQKVIELAIQLSKPG
ncbi:hypothetical protein BH11PSE4_BH11PSE4_25590 [soil metagenome]